MEVLSVGLEAAVDEERGMQTQQAITQGSQASVQFGRIIHGVAVKMANRSTENGKGKSEIARRVGTDKSVILAITGGGAHAHDRELLERLVSAVADEVPPDTLKHLRSLIQEIKPAS